jgi:tetratricopeptide (TPR) repeat protein
MEAKVLDRHPTLEEIGELLDPEVAPALAGWLADHLFQCSQCWDLASDTVARLAVSVSQAPATGAAGRDSALRALAQRFRLEQGRLEETLVAQAAISDLNKLNRKGRRELIAKRPIYKNRAVVEELLAEARKASSPGEGEEWATLALTACHQLSSSEYSTVIQADLLAQGFAELASARRRSARWSAAREALKDGHHHASRGSKSRAIEGLLFQVEGAIEGDIGSLTEAETTLKKAHACFSSCGETRLVAKVLVQLAYIWIDANPSKSLEYLDIVTPLVPQYDKKLLLLAENNRIDCLLTLGYNHQALRKFVRLRELMDQFADPFLHLRRRFMAGRLLEASRRFPEADAIFREVIAADLEQRSTKSLYLDLIYLFGSYVRRGDFARAIEVCRDAISQLSILEIDTASEQQMKGLWSRLGKMAQEGAVVEEIVDKSRRFIRNQWKTTGGDALATKESAV